MEGEREERVFKRRKYAHPRGRLRKPAKRRGFLPPRAFGGIYRCDLPLG
jgi:hypothetical protein